MDTSGHSQPASLSRTPMRSTILISNLHCTSCISSIEAALSQLHPTPRLQTHSIITHTVEVLHEVPIEVISQLLSDQGFELDSIQLNGVTVPVPTPRPWTPTYTSRGPQLMATSDYKSQLHRENCKQCRLEKEEPEKQQVCSHMSESPVIVDSLSNSSPYLVTLAIDGMTCASCVGSITGVLDQTSWVLSADVNLLTGTAVVKVVRDDQASALVELIEDMGFAAAIQSVDPVREQQDSSQDQNRTRRNIDMLVDGIYCHHCPSRIDVALRGVPGLSVERLPTVEDPIMRVSYVPIPSELTVRTILSAIASADPALSARIYHPISLEERARQVHARQQRGLLLRLILSGILAVPTFVIGIVYMNIVDENNTGRKLLMRRVSGVTCADIALFVLASPVYFFAADLFHRRAIKELRTLWHPRSRVPVWKRFVRFGSMSTLISMGTTIAYFSSIAELAIAASDPAHGLLDSTTYSYFDSVVFLTLFLLLGRLIEAYSKSKAGDAVAVLAKLRPRHALLITSTGHEAIPLDQLDVGDHVQVACGESPPCDGIVVSGVTVMDESSLTGESRPISKQAGDDVYAGTINKGSHLIVQIKKPAGTSMLDQIITAVRDGQTKRAPVERVVDKLTSYFAPAVTAVAIITWLVWLILGQSGRLPPSWKADTVGGWPFWSLQFAIAVFVIACPCGIGLAAPTALFVGGGLAAKHGILVKGGGEAFQEASQLDCVVFDKTGTLTVGREPLVADFERVDDMVLPTSQLDSAILALESTSTHPVAKAFVAMVNAGNVTPLNVVEAEEIPGRGMRGVFATTPCLQIVLGNEALMSMHGVQLTTTQRVITDDWSRAAKTPILVAARYDSSPFTLAAMASISDPIRPEARSVIEALQSLNMATYLLTGDNALTAHAVGSQLNIPSSQIISSVLPTEKASHIQSIQRTFSSRGRPRATVAMIGDGINDAPALAAADVGIAIGSGADVAINAAHFVLVRSDLTALLTLVRLSRKVFKRVRYNFAWAVAYNLLAMPVAAGVLYPLTVKGKHVRLDPVWAAVAMAGSSVSVVVSSLALRWRRVRGVGFRG